MKKNIFCVDQVLIIAKTSQSENLLLIECAQEAKFEFAFHVVKAIIFLPDVNAIVANI